MTFIDLHAGIKDIEREIDVEMVRSFSIHRDKFTSPLEAYGVVVEEYHEVVEAFRLSKDKYPEGNVKLRMELVQLAAMCKKACYSFWDPELFDERVLEYSIENHTYTMTSLGAITRDYNKIGELYAASYKLMPAIMSLLHGLYVGLYVTCRSAIVSNCVHNKEE